MNIPLARACLSWLIGACAAGLFLAGLVVGVAALCNDTGPGSTAIPPPASQPHHPPAETILKVITFNVQDTWVVGHHRPERMQAIAQTLIALDPDVVCFQEALAEDGRQVLVRALAQSRLKYSHYFRSRKLGSGLLICSAWPIQATAFHRFTQSGPWWKPWEGDWWVGKGVALASLELPGLSLDVFNTHTQAGYENPAYHAVRGHQLEELAAFVERARSHAGPALLLGDMNCRTHHAEYLAVIQNARLSRMMTIPSGVDHIFAISDPGFRIESVGETRKIEGRIAVRGTWTDLSDHPGYMSTLRIRPAEKSPRPE